MGLTTSRTLHLYVLSSANKNNKRTLGFVERRCKVYILGDNYTSNWKSRCIRLENDFIWKPNVIVSSKCQKTLPATAAIQNVETPNFSICISTLKVKMFHSKSSLCINDYTSKLPRLWNSLPPICTWNNITSDICSRNLWLPLPLRNSIKNESVTVARFTSDIIETLKVWTLFLLGILTMFTFLHVFYTYSVHS